MKLITKLNTKTLLAATLMLFFGTTSSVFAQEEEVAEDSEGLTISGSVDTYFHSGEADKGSTVAPATSFANLPGFSLGMINLITTYEKGKSGFVADVVIGPRGAEAVFGSGPSQNLVNQLYAYLNVSDKITLTMGNFNTFLGYEVISPTANYNYSTSYMFSYGPFSHTGFKADIDLGGGLSFMTGVFNATDATEFNPDGTYTAGAQLGYSGDSGSAYLNLLVDEDYTQVDLTTGWDVSDKAYLGFNGTYASAEVNGKSGTHFYGAALYAQLSTSEAFSLGARAEYFADENGVAITGGESIIDITISANYKTGNLTIIPEFRLDSGSKEEFIDKDLKASKTLSTFLLAAVYSF